MMNPYSVPYNAWYGYNPYAPYHHSHLYHYYGGQSFVPLTGNFAGGHFSGTGGFAAAPHIGTAPAIGHIGGAGFAGVHIR